MPIITVYVHLLASLAAGGVIGALDGYLSLLARIRFSDPILSNEEIFNVDWNREMKRESGFCTCQMDAKPITAS